MGNGMIRKATINDLEEMILLGFDMHQESRWQVMDFNVEKVARFFTSCIDSSDYLVIVSEEAGKLIGGFVGYAMPHWFSDDVMAGDFALFIHPDHRGGLVAIKLIKHFVEWAKGKNAILIQLGISTGVNLEKTSRLYERLGFEKMGIMFDLKRG